MDPAMDLQGAGGQARRRMRRHFINAAYGLADYVSYPLVMLVAAPVVLRKLGASEYGLWIIATAVISTGGIVASGFSDACLRRIASLRSSGDMPAMARTLRSMLGIHIVLGSLLALGVWIASPYAAPRIAVSSSVSAQESLLALRIGGVLILARAIESVAISTQRAFERYREPVQVSVLVRLLTLGSAIVLALSGRRAVSLMVATGVFLILGAWAQFRQLKKVFGDLPLWPLFRTDETNHLLGSGVFLWLQAIGGVLFGYLDRILLGIYLGAFAVTPYVLCIQFSQPIFGITASSLHFLFPHLSARAGSFSRGQLQRAVLKAFALNLLMVAGITSVLLLFGGRFIHLWAGAAVAKRIAGVLQPVVLGAAFTALSVTGVYALQALGLFRTVSILLLSCRMSMSLLMFFLLRREGLSGLLIVRVLYGASTLLVYLPLIQQLRKERVSAISTPSRATAEGLTGGANA